METAKIIKTTGEEKEVKPKNGYEFTLEELQLFVGGMIELVHTKNGKEMYINEEGKILELEPNQKATQLYEHSNFDIIVGDVVILTKNNN